METFHENSPLSYTITNSYFLSVLRTMVEAVIGRKRRTLFEEPP
jgi:hypothetical protein